MNGCSLANYYEIWTELAIVAYSGMMGMGEVTGEQRNYRWRFGCDELRLVMGGSYVILSRSISAESYPIVSLLVEAVHKDCVQQEW
jgi:hypothetical protein